MVCSEEAQVFAKGINYMYEITTIVNEQQKCVLYSFVKEHPPSKECPRTTFGPISCIGSKLLE